MGTVEYVFFRKCTLLVKFLYNIGDTQSEIARLACIIICLKILPLYARIILDFIEPPQNEDIKTNNTLKYRRTYVILHSSQCFS